MSADDYARLIANDAVKRIKEHEERCETRYKALERGLEKLDARHYQLIKTVAFAAVGVVVSILISAVIVTQ